MISTISTWRCKCGLRVKAIGETPKNRPGATVTAQCPNCGDGQLIYANRIISITNEDDKPAPTQKRA